MNYELSKKLKEAGFPQPFVNDTKPLVLYPSLSELIAECGDKFAGILSKKSANGYIWKAFENFYMITPEPSRSFHSFLAGKRCDGSTPEEAVANLWLALNKID